MNGILTQADLKILFSVFALLDNGRKNAWDSGVFPLSQQMEYFKS
jgi:hypothetical protein